MRRLLVLATALLVAAVATLGADARTEQKVQVKFEGMLGRVVGLFGGNAAREGATSTVFVKGDRKMTVTGNRAALIDLAEQKVYDIDLRDKSYKVTTFDELRRRMQEAQERARKEEGREKEPSEKEYELDVDIKDTGQQKTIASYNCRQKIMTITVHEKGRKIEQSGGMVLVADSWLAPTMAPMKEVTDFDIRYAKAMLGVDPTASAEQMAAALAMYPGMREAMSKFQGERGSFQGTPLETTVTVQSVKTAEQVEAEQKRAGEGGGGGIGGGVGGMLGGLGRRIGRKKEDASADKSRATVMTSMVQVLSVSENVAATDVAIPAGFRQK